MQRFWDKVEKSNGCWNWLASTDGRYGVFWSMGRKVKAHRFSIELNGTDIPPGMLVCHKCDNTLCVNPEHLFLGTHSDNTRDAFNKGRMISPTQRKGFICHNARKTHCKNGHSLSGENLYMPPDGGRVCKQCASQSRLKYQISQKSRKALNPETAND